MFMITRNWLMIPQFLYYILLAAGGILAVVSIGMILYGTVRKKSGRYILCGLTMLIIGVVLVMLTMTQKIVGHMMVGG